MHNSTSCTHCSSMSSYTCGPRTFSCYFQCLNYSSAIWDPNHEVHRRSLERVQNFAARVTLNDWRTDPQCLRDKLDWPPLQKRRTFQKICLCRRILTGQSIIPPPLSSFLTPDPLNPTKTIFLSLDHLSDLPPQLFFRH